MKRTTPPLRVNPVPLTVLAAGLLAWATVLTVIAGVGRERIVPAAFDLIRVEHFIAFYILAFLAAASLPALKFRWLLLGILAVATAIAVFRATLAQAEARVFIDWASNLAGALAAVAPVALARHRDAFLAATADPASKPGPSRAAQAH